jgi:hypothetical protein
MLQEKISLTVIVKITGLSLEEVKKIQAALRKASAKSTRSVKSKATKKKN